MALESMARALTPVNISLHGVEKIQASVWMGQTFLDEGTGLYYGTDRKVLEKLILRPLWEGVKEVRDRTEQTIPVLQQAVELTKTMMDVLIRRVRNPSLQMKKRKARKYRKKIQVTHGPFPSTIELAVKICLEVGNGVGLGERQEEEVGSLKGVEEAHHFVTEFERLWFCQVDMLEDAKRLVKEAEKGKENGERSLSESNESGEVELE